MSKKIFNLLLLISLWCIIGYSKEPAKVYVEWIATPKADVTGINRIAILDFQSYPYEYGRRCATILTSELLKQKYYQIIERGEIARLAEEQALSLSGLVSEDTAAELGKILGCDAIILGEVSAGLDKNEGKEKVKKVIEVPTGKYRTVKERKYVIFGPKVEREVPIMEEREVLVDQDYVIKQGSISVTFKMVNVNTAAIITAEEVKKVYSQKASGKDEIAKLPADKSILDRLLEDAVKEIIPKISPYKLQDLRYLEYGRKNQKFIHEGVNLALNNRWDEAINKWNEQIRIDGDKADAAFSNLGVGYEIKGDFKKAEEYYKKACDLKPTRETFKHNYNRLVYRLTTEITEEVGVELGVTKVKMVIHKENNNVYIDVGEIDDAQIGDIYIIYEEKIIKHPVTGEVMGKEEVEKAKIKIIKVFEKMSVGEVIDTKFEEINIKDKVKLLK